MQERATAIETALLFFELEWAALDDARAEELLAADGLDFAPPPPAHRAPLPPAPALRARGADPHREGADRPHRLDAAVRGAGVGDHGRAARRRPSRSRSRSRWRGCSRPDRERAARHRRARHGGAAARPAHARVRVQHAAGGQDGRGPPAQLPALARQPQPRQRGVRRVGRGAARPPCAPATRCRAAGTASRRGCSASTGSPTTTAWPPSREEDEHVALERGARPRARLLRLVLGRARRPRAALLRRALDRRAGAPEQARRRVLRLHRAVGAPVRAAQLHLPPPRRAHARPRARATACTRRSARARASSTWARR